jgi:type II secretory pathway predicted ATPase ExeA
MYLRFYNFSQLPFHVTPDPNFLFQTGCHKEALAAMVYGIRERKGFISISGEIGTGKTTLIHQLLNTLGRKVKIVPIYQTHITFEELLRQVLFELELPTGDGTKTSMVRQLRQRIGIRRQILPLEEKESRQYMEHRLKRAGSTLSRVFTPEAVSLICRAAGGFPRTINMICDNALLIGYSLTQKPINAAIVREALADLRLADKKGPARQKERQKARARVATQRAWGFSFGKFAYALWVPVAAAVVVFGGEEYLRTVVKRTLEEFSIGKAIVQQESVLRPSGGKPEESSTTAPAAERKPKPSPSQKYRKVPNTTLADFLLEFNSEIIDADRLMVRQGSDLPEISEESPIIKTSDGTYKIWLGTFLRADLAGFLMIEPALQGKKIVIVAREVAPGKTWYRAIAGDYATKEECLETIRVLKKKGLLPIFVRMKESDQ